MSPAPAAVIFDMDGLMLDTEPLAARAWGEAAATLGVDFDMSLAQGMIGRNFADCSAMLRARYVTPYPVDALLGRGMRLRRDRRARRSRAQARRPRIARLARGRRDSPRRGDIDPPRPRAREASRNGALPRFHEIVGGDEVAFGKPAPDIYVEAARRLGAIAAACLVLEDSEPGCARRSPPA
jgi:beta-phosphoglucomutase-like phosphatase (HAD superfamily)